MTIGKRDERGQVETRDERSDLGGTMRLGGQNCRLEPGSRVSYDGPPRPGLEHHLVMLEGGLLITVDGTSHALRPGDSADPKGTLAGSLTYLAIWLVICAAGIVALTRRRPEPSQ